MIRPAQRGPRERLVEAAERLTYREGAGVGIAALLKEANVARRSLYEHFGGKDELLAEVLRGAAAKDLDAYRAAMSAAGPDAARRILAIFDHLEAAVTAEGFRGCRYLGADLALQDPEHPAHAVAREYRAELHRLIQHELDRLGHAESADEAERIMFLIEGTLASAVTRPDARPARIAADLAAHILRLGPADASKRGRATSAP
ncbi:TetR family transcriptional regulator [Kribbella deserti]|uniref:TetR family transcriptional regulator n=1 Tax=Kribbella deserti TaxID=1926257 RepID=A0ABV6QIC3_9ACTN